MQTNNNCIVIFGASGDLTHRKLIPALYNLFKFGRLNKFSVLGVARSELNDDTFREKNDAKHFFKQKKLRLKRSKNSVTISITKR